MPTKNLAAKLIVGPVMACFLTSGAHATILTFDTNSNNPSGFIPLDQSYGDRVTATVQGLASYGVGAEGFTPNVVVDYLGAVGGPTAAFSRATSNYGDLVNIIANQNTNFTRIVLTADPGFDVVLYGFDLAGWPNFNYTLSHLSVTSGPSVLFSLSEVPVRGAPPAPRHTSFEFAGGLNGGQSLTLNMNLASLFPFGPNVGLDNLRFGQVDLTPPPPPPLGGVPEPATWAMMIVGFASVGGMLRRRAAPRAGAAA